MHSRRFASRLTLWTFAAALVLKSAVPMLASAAAGLQGRALAEVCDVYGVDTSSLGLAAVRAAPLDAAAPAPHRHVHGQHDAAAAAPGGDAPQPHPGGHGRHGSDHCALTGMVALAAEAAPAFAGPAAAAPPAVLEAPAAAGVFDATARWAALLRHGPPALS